jgi:arginyl-tRNA synthetase
MNIKLELEAILTKALELAGAPAGTAAMVVASARPEFGDYQANGVMGAAKKLRLNPRQLADKVTEQLRAAGQADISDIAEKIEVAGPGFINIYLRKDWLTRQLAVAAKDDRLGLEKLARPLTVVVDYSAPNLAKEMHVGHLRSTIIGDALARTLEYQGNNVIRQNHVGDWGTQFGMLLAYMDRQAGAEAAERGQVELADLEDFYRQAKQLFDSDPAFADLSRQYVVRLQAGDEHCLKNWRMFLEKSLGHCENIYARLGVSLSRQHVRGESAYNDDLANVVSDLDKGGWLRESQGAQCVFLPEFTAKDGSPLPLIVRKSDEGFLYATTDLAAIRYRAGQLHADRVLYVVDARQALHFRQVFAVARQAGFADDNIHLEHIAFGTMMGSDGKPFKTRSGGTVKLVDLLNEAVDKATEMVKQKNPDLPADQQQQIAETVGIGAVKYADLAQNRNSDYVFAWDKMLSLEGNTAPYMQYAYARIRSIFRKGEQTLEQSAGSASDSSLIIAEPSERQLAVKLLQWPEAVTAVAAECLPSILCAYLYDLAGAFTGFYENCPVLKSDQPTRASRLALCDLTARVIRTGLGLLGIGTIEQM